MVMRHPEVAAEWKNICYGHAEAMLLEPVLLSNELLTTFASQKIDRIYSSPSVRCVELAKAIAISSELNVPLLIDARLHELHFGQWEGKAWDDIEPDELNPWMENFVTVRPPGGESFVELRERISAFTNTLPIDAHTLVVTSAGPIRAMLHLFEGVPLEKTFERKVGYGEVFIFDR